MEVLCPFLRKSMVELEVVQREVMRVLKDNAQFLCLKYISKVSARTMDGRWRI